MKARPLLNPIARGKPNQETVPGGACKLLFEEFQSRWGLLLLTWKRHLDKLASTSIHLWKARSPQPVFPEFLPRYWSLIRTPS